jgi:hypothetical protein
VGVGERLFCCGVIVRVREPGVGVVCPLVACPLPAQAERQISSRLNPPAATEVRRGERPESRPLCRTGVPEMQASTPAENARRRVSTEKVTI